MNPELTSLTRPYRGLSQEQRRADRRARLTAAAIAVYGERGYRHATVKAVCDAAGLTERYFYESFANSEALLIHSFNAVADSLLDRIITAADNAGPGRAARARAMLHAFFEALQEAPHSARVFLVEIRGVSRPVDLAFDGALRAIGCEAARYVAAPGVDEQPLLQAGVVGGVMHIALRWIEDGYAPGVDAVVDSALRLGAVLAPRQPAASLSAMRGRATLSAAPGL